MNIFQKLTLKNLKENRTRTLVTIVGIILSAAMFSATTISLSTLRHCLIQSTIYDNGNWYGTFQNVSAKNAEIIASNDKISQTVSMEFLGYSMLEGCTNNSKPYLGVYGIQKDFTDMMPIHITSGRMPENSSEILLPNHLSYNGGVEYELNDTLELRPGIRQDDTGQMLTNDTEYLNNPDLDNSRLYSEDDRKRANTKEELIPGEARTYKVTGFYARPSFEDYSTPAYTALTIGENDSENLYHLYVRTVSGKDAVSTLMAIHEGLTDSDYCSSSFNYDLLRLYGYSGESRYNSVLFGLGAILIAIIMFGSISLIYNAFSISVSERTRQFGLLSSIGATRRQLTGSVLFEALFLGCIGIPLGILSGLLGIGVTFFFTGDMIGRVLGIPGTPGISGMDSVIQALGPAKQVSLSLHPSLAALAAAILISMLTILISAYLPVRRAVKKSAIDAIRQTEDIAIRPGKVKTSRLTEKFFGFEGMLATKNYKRNRKKYRATVISLFLSIVLFISASSWCSYLMKSINTVISNADYDIFYTYHEDEEGYPLDEIFSELSNMKNVTGSVYSSQLYYLTGSLNTASLSQDYRNYQKELAEAQGNEYKEYASSLADFQLNFLEDEAFLRYLEEQNLPKSIYYDREHPTAILIDALRVYGYDGRYLSHNMFSDIAGANLQLHVILMAEDFSRNLEIDKETGEIQCVNWDYNNDTEYKEPLEEGCRTIPITIGTTLPNTPALFADEQEIPQLFFPYSFMDEVFSSLEPDEDYQNISGVPLSEKATKHMYFQCENHAETYEAMRRLLADKDLSPDNIFDYAASVDNDRAMVTVINVFAFGFITLISLIAAANIFNTISTNINLRRREFAMLKSVGLTPESFRKMMNFECLLYGFKGLLYGLPVSFLVTLQIYRTISNGLDSSFYIPWYSVALAVFSVFLVVFVTMLYSMSKIKKENTIDALKNENL
jgi:putative ABC transport system permease protein